MPAQSKSITHFRPFSICPRSNEDVTDVVSLRTVSAWGQILSRSHCLTIRHRRPRSPNRSRCLLPVVLVIKRSFHYMDFFGLTNGSTASTVVSPSFAVSSTAGRVAGSAPNCRACDASAAGDGDFGSSAICWGVNLEVDALLTLIQRKGRCRDWRREWRPERCASCSRDGEGLSSLALRQSRQMEDRMLLPRLARGSAGKLLSFTAFQSDRGVTC